MRIIRTLVMLGAAGAGISYLRKRRAGQGADPRPEDRFAATGAEMADTDLAAVATQSGIADVDPTPISHVAGEGIDLERDTRAHDDIERVRERMPRHES